MTFDDSASHKLYKDVRVDVLASIGESTVIETPPYASAGSIELDPGTNTALTLYGALQAQDGTYKPIFDAAGAAVTITVSADGVYEIPKVGSFRFLKLVADAAAVTGAKVFFRKNAR